MKTLVVLSDSHARCAKKLQKLQPIFAENDFIIHLGDGSADLRQVLSSFPDKTYLCAGNCDLSYGSEEFVLQVEGVSILCCHGHRFGVKSGLARLAAYAKEKGCDVALYGHTHSAHIERVDGVLCINPGALGSYSDPSYCYLAVHRDRVTPTIVPLI